MSKHPGQFDATTQGPCYHSWKLKQCIRVLKSCLCQQFTLCCVTKISAGGSHRSRRTSSSTVPSWWAGSASQQKGQPVGPCWSRNRERVKRWPPAQGVRTSAQPRHASPITLHWPEQVVAVGGLSLPLERVPELWRWPTFTVPGTRPPPEPPPACLPAPHSSPSPGAHPQTPAPLSLPLYPTAHPLQPPLAPLSTLQTSGPLHQSSPSCDCLLPVSPRDLHPSRPPSSGSTCCGGGERSFPTQPPLDSSPQAPGSALRTPHTTPELTHGFWGLAPTVEAAPANRQPCSFPAPLCLWGPEQGLACQRHWNYLPTWYLCLGLERP